MGFNERLGEMRREADTRHRAALAEADEVSAREFTAEDAADCVRVTVDGDGAVRTVRVNPRRFDAMDGDELGRRVIEAVRAARRASREGTRDVRERLYGGDTDTLRDSIRSAPSSDLTTGDQPPEPDSVDAMMDEFRRFRAGLAGWADGLAGQEAIGEGARGSVRAFCAASGKVTRVELDTYFPRTVRPEQAEAAILRALQRAQADAARRVAAHQERLEFMGLPIGEVVSRKRSLTDLLGIPPDGSLTGRRHQEQR